MVLDKIINYTEKDGDVLLDGNNGVEVNIRIREFKGHKVFLKFHDKGEDPKEENDLDISNNEVLSAKFGVANEAELKAQIVGVVGFVETNVNEELAIEDMLAEIKSKGYYIVIR